MRSVGTWGSRAHILPLLARVSLGLLFIVAGALKLSHPADLAATITALRLGLPPQLVAIVAIALPPFEILLGAYILAGFFLMLSAGVATALLVVFIAVLSSAVSRGLSAPCGCFGPGDDGPTTWWTVLRDGAMIVPALYLLWWAKARTGHRASEN